MKFLASLKLAVIVICLMTVMMVAGTLIESRSGPEYAKAAVYFSPFFLAVEIFLFLNILFAALVRLPPKKRLAGFYIVHAGLLFILGGAAVTAFFGLDGSLELVPGEAARHVRIENPRLHVIVEAPGAAEGKVYSEAMPRVAGAYEGLDKTFLRAGDYDLGLEKYYPFATAKTSWEDDAPGTLPSMTLWLTLANDNMRQPISLSGAAPETSRVETGALVLELVPETTSDCFARAVADEKTKYLYVSPGKCVPMKDWTAAGSFSSEGVEFTKEKDKPFLKIVATDGGVKRNFYPQMTPSPISDDIRILGRVGVKLMDLGAVRKTAHVLFFADRRFAAGKGAEWRYAESAAASENPLPWMGFTMTLDRVIHARHEKLEWRYEAPRQDAEAGRGRAAYVKIASRSGPEVSEKIWIDDAEPKSVTMKDGTVIRLLIGPEMTRLPFELELDRFKMDTVPGTDDPASYESFVKVKGADGERSEHVFMNHPLKRDGFTFYQASYFQTENGAFGSVLSVNRDPGRALKYLGSLMLVAGCVAHYALRARRE